MLELLGNPWFGLAFVIGGPLVLFLLVRRRRRLEEEGQAGARKPATNARASTTAPRAGERRSSASLAGVPALEQGFRELRWGSAPAEGMVPVHQTDEHSLYSRPSDALRIGNVQVSSIVYVYHRDRLQAAIIELSASGFEVLARHLKAEWGAPKAWKQDTRFAWADARAGEEATQAVLEKQAETRTAKLVISSKAMAAAKDRAPAAS